MNEACQNLSCQQHGADMRYIKLHAQTQRRFKYHVKHAYNLSTDYNQYSEWNPWHGARQGTGDVAPRWVVQSHSLIIAYHSQAMLWQLPNLVDGTTIPMGIDAFMDNTNHLLGNSQDDHLHTILPSAQNNLDLWQALIQASGGMLNPTKCSWTPFLWHFDRHGNPRLVDPPPSPRYHITAPDRHGDRHTLHRNKPTDAVCLLGVHIAANGNHAKELNILRSRQTQYCAFLQRTSLSQQEAKVIYWQCYLPKVTYPLPATTMPPTTIYKTQVAVTALFLNKMGYQRHMPRAVVYAPATVGGLDFRHLGFEQGVQQTLQLVKHLQVASTNGVLYHSLIDAYQIHSGIAQPILEDTRTLPWSSPSWMTSIRQFLHSTGTNILLQNPWVPRPRRINDRNIMEDALEFLPTNTNLCALNNVRLYLHVTFLSEITDASGTFIRDEYLTEMPPRPASTLRWPYQINLLPENWKVWRNAILQLYATGPSTRLAQPLTSWHLEHTFTDWEWEWRIDPTTHAL